MKGGKYLNIFVLDVIVSAIASLAAGLIVRFIVSAFPDFVTHLLIWTAVAAICSIPAVHFSKIDRILFRYASFKSVLNLFLCAAIKTALLGAFILLVRKHNSSLPVSILLFDFSATCLALIFFKLSVSVVMDSNNSANEPTKIRVAIFGTSPKSISIVTRYNNSNTYSIEGFITRDPGMNGRIIMEHNVTYLPMDANLDGSAFKDIEAVLFTSEEDRILESGRLVKSCMEKGICVLTIPHTQNTNFPGLELAEIKHILEDKFVPDKMGMLERTIKRLIDIVGSAILIVVFSPLMLAIALILRIKEGNPVLFRQERIGHYGRPFYILKFRSMRNDAESKGPELFKGKDDSRLTKTGKFLRDHHLDELPQLFNVFVGDMSFVGYRPERKYYINKIVEIDPRYAYLYQMRPGVTSYSTLRNGYTDTMEKMLNRLNYDLYYLNHRSLLTDAKVLWDTFANIALGKKF